MGTTRARMPATTWPAMAQPRIPPAENGNPLVDMQATMPMSKLDDPGIGLRDNGRRVLTYADLGSTFPDPDGREPGRDHRAAPDRPHGAVRVVVRRHQVLRRRTAALHLRRAPAHRARQRHDDDAPDPPARHVERSRERRRRFHGAQAHHRHAAGHAAHLSRRARTRSGRWAYHCHLLFHMEAGMFREVRVGNDRAGCRQVQALRCQVRCSWCAACRHADRRVRAGRRSRRPRRARSRDQLPGAVRSARVAVRARRARIALGQPVVDRRRSQSPLDPHRGRRG